MTELKPQRLFAFWEYDRFPFCLGGEVLRICDSGNIEAVGYTGMTFKPIVILPFEAGVALKEKLSKVESKFNKDKLQLQRIGLIKVKKLINVPVRIK